MRTRVIEFCLVMSCFLLMFLVNFIQSLEQQETVASLSALQLKEKLNLENSQVAAIKEVNVKFYEAMSIIKRHDFNDEHAYDEALRKVKSNHREKILETLTQQQQQLWQDVLKEECLDGH